MVNVLATFCMTLAIVYLVSFAVNTIKISNLKVTLALRSAVFAIMAFALTSSKFAGGNKLIAIIAFCFAGLSIIGEILNDKHNPNQILDVLLTEAVSIASGIVLLNLA